MIRTIEQALAATPAIQSIIVIMMLRIKSAIHTSSGQFIYALKLPCTFTASCFCVWRSFSFSSRFLSISCKAAFLSADILSDSPGSGTVSPGLFFSSISISPLPVMQATLFQSTPTRCGRFLCQVCKKFVRNLSWDLYKAIQGKYNTFGWK